MILQEPKITLAKIPKRGFVRLQAISGENIWCMLTGGSGGLRVGKLELDAGGKKRGDVIEFPKHLIHEVL